MPVDHKINTVTVDAFFQTKPVVGVIQLPPLPGAANWGGSMERVLQRAEQEATAFAACGVDALLLENRQDLGYRDRVDTATVSAFTMIVRQVQALTQLPVGISVLPNDPETALAIVLTTGAEMIRLPVLLGARLTPQGILESRLGPMLAYAERLKLTKRPQLWVDVSMEHLRTESPQPGLAIEAVLASIAQPLAQVERVDAVVVNLQEVSPESLDAFSQKTHLPIMVAGPFSPDNAAPYFQQAHGLLIGEGLKKQSVNSAPEAEPFGPAIDPVRVEALFHSIHRSPGAGFSSASGAFPT
ncbi:MAG: BtpA/SgcQ family protein [Candidatus Melainabacteria bacterium]|nr:BtpA/SgcQ family protein [Candidatus Melainabacteria bacterium]